MLEVNEHTADGALSDSIEQMGLSPDAVDLDAKTGWLLPGNFWLSGRSEVNAWPPDTKELLAYIREHDDQVGVYNDGRQDGDLVLRSVIVQLPVVVYIAGSTGAAVIIAGLLKLIPELLRRYGDDTQVELLELEVQRPSTKITFRRLKGPAQELENVLRERLSDKQEDG